MCATRVGWHVRGVTFRSECEGMWRDRVEAFAGRGAVAPLEPQPEETKVYHAPLRRGALRGSGCYLHPGRRRRARALAASPAHFLEGPREGGDAPALSRPSVAHPRPRRHPSRFQRGPFVRKGRCGPRTRRLLGGGATPAWVPRCAPSGKVTWVFRECAGAPRPSRVRSAGCAARRWRRARVVGVGARAATRSVPRGVPFGSEGLATWLILPVVICLSQRLSHACVSINSFVL